MQSFIDSIKQSIASQNWFGALFIALALPDICSALETPNRPVGERYKDWFNRYLKNKYDPSSQYESLLARNPEIIRSMGEHAESMKNQKLDASLLFTAEDCYQSRCKCLHQGYVQRASGETFVFITPPPGNSIVHQNLFNGQFQLQIDVFCQDMCEAVQTWEEDVKNSGDVQTRIKGLLQIKHYGVLEPSIRFNS